MESIKEPGRSRRKFKRVFTFCPNKIIKQQPSGNRLKSIHIDCPNPRSGHRIVVRGGNIYVFGGYTPMQNGAEIEHVLFKELWKYNCASETWKLLDTSGKIPEQLASHCAVLLDNHMVYFGGTGIPFGETSSNSTYVCNLDTLEWINLETTGASPLEQYGQAMTVYDNKMYVVGGTNGFSYSMYVHCLDLCTKEWKYLQDNRGPYDWGPEPRYRHEIAIEDNQIFVFGGGTAFESFDFKEVPVFNLVDNTWSKAQTSEEYPEARRCHGCVQMGNDVYICGGHDGSTIFSDIWNFNLKSLQWKKLQTTLPNPVYFHSASVSKAGQLFVFGGVTSNSIVNNSRTNELYSMWLKIPSLADICWQAVLKYVPYISQLDKAQLHQAGIPFRFIKEVDFEPLPSIAINHCCSRIQS